MRTRLLATCAVLLLLACGKAHETKSTSSVNTGPRPNIVFITLDTTRVDAIGPEAVGIETPSYNALVKRGLRFRQAYCTVPQTLPSHTSMLTGLYPGGHGVHENARNGPPERPLPTRQLPTAG